MIEQKNTYIYMHLYILYVDVHVYEHLCAYSHIHKYTVSVFYYMSIRVCIRICIHSHCNTPRARLRRPKVRAKPLSLQNPR